MLSRKSSDIQLSALENAMQQFDEAAERLNIDKTMLEILKQPRRSVIVKLPIQMDDGRFEVFTGYRVQHSISFFPAEDGIRYGFSGGISDFSFPTAAIKYCLSSFIFYNSSYNLHV